MREILVDQYGLKGRFTVIPTGIDLEAYRTAAGTGFAGGASGKRTRS
jgi:hypothetical protein